MRSRILLVDDDEFMQLKMQWELQAEFDPWTAGSAEEALRVLAGGPVSAVVADLRLDAGADGLQLLRQIARSAPTCGRVLVSGLVPQDTVRSALASGVVHRFLAKPWGRGALGDAIREATALGVSGTAGHR